MTGKEAIIHYLETHQNFCATTLLDDNNRRNNIWRGAR